VPEEIKHYFETFQHEYDKDKKQFYHFDTEKKYFLIKRKKKKRQHPQRQKETPQSKDRTSA